MLEHATDTVSFFQAMGPHSHRQYLTVTFVYSLAKFTRRSARRRRVTLPICG
jgi:hypothetical protein